jgi:hypothetical protein
MSALSDPSGTTTSNGREASVTPYMRYRLEIDLTDADVEALAAGTVTETVRQHAWSMLEWQRRYLKSDAYAEELARAEREVEWP